MEIHTTEMDCLECNEKFKSQEKLMEHMDENECDHCRKWLCCGTYLRKHKEKEHEMTSGEGSKDKGKKKVSSKDEEIGDVGRMVSNLSSQPNRSGEDSLQKDETRLESAKKLEEINAIEKQKAKEIEKLE